MEKRRTVFFSSNLPLAAGYQDIFRQPKNTATHFQLQIFTLHDEMDEERKMAEISLGKTILANLVSRFLYYLLA